MVCASLYNPPRSEAMAALAQCREAGIRVDMILDKMSDADLACRCDKISAYARMTDFDSGQELPSDFHVFG